MDAGWLWLLPAATIVWVLGAYNRMVRLRGRVLRSFVAVDRCLVRYIQLVDETVSGTSPAALVSTWVGLQSASVQLDNNLRIARQRALDAASIAALLAALCTLQVWWLRLGEQAVAHPGAVSDSRRSTWTENTRQERDASALFNTAVAAHNDAVRQFPASLLARLFGFREAGSL